MLDLFSVTYEDKHAAALVFKQLQTTECGVEAVGMEKTATKSRRTRTLYRLLIGVSKDLSCNLPSLLRTVKDSLKEHPLYSYVSWDFHIVPITNNNWNLDSYDDADYQQIFINKRKAWNNVH